MFKTLLRLILLLMVVYSFISVVSIQFEAVKADVEERIELYELDVINDETI